MQVLGKKKATTRLHVRVSLNSLEEREVRSYITLFYKIRYIAVNNVVVRYVADRALAPDISCCLVML